MQILEDNTRPSTSQMFGQAFANAGQSAAQGAGQYLKGKAENAKLKSLGFDVEGISDPNTRSSVLQDQMTFGRKMKQAGIASGVNDQIYGNKLASGGENKAQGQPDEFGNFPQPETEGVKQKIQTPDELVRTGRRIAQMNREQGNPMDDEEGIRLAKTRNDEIKDYNRDVEADKEQRVNTQERYGKKAEDSLLKLLPDATDEQIAKFRKIGEESAKKSMSEGDIDKLIATETKNYKNMISRIENSKDAPLAFEKMKGAVLGTNRDFEKIKTNLRHLMKPLLDEGMYDTARMLLAKKGFGPETIEGILGDLGEGAKQEIAKIPEFKEITPVKIGAMSFDKKQPTQEAYQAMGDSIGKVLQREPGTNLILLRKGLMDKGMNWESYKDKIDELIDQGEINLTEDQWNQYSKLNQNVLDNLDKMLEDVNLVEK